MSHGRPLRAAAVRPADCTASGIGLHEAALKKHTSRGMSNSARWQESIALTTL
jgi:hypothetical protein